VAKHTFKKPLLTEVLDNVIPKVLFGVEIDALKSRVHFGGLMADGRTSKNRGNLINRGVLDNQNPSSPLGCCLTYGGRDQTFADAAFASD
jgi:hypothetical protein